MGCSGLVAECVMVTGHVDVGHIAVQCVVTHQIYINKVLYIGSVLKTWVKGKVETSLSTRIILLEDPMNR